MRMKSAIITATAWLLAAPLLAQGPSSPSGRGTAPIDLTGRWVSLVTEDWRWRMVMPARGDYQSVPITLEAKKVADAWDPAKDEAAGEQCRAYGAAALMRLPTRLHITWADDNTLKVETDYGEQTRLLHFGAPPRSSRPTWQGDSVATWESPRRPNDTGPLRSFGSLGVSTSNMRPGYLRKNGVPYSGNAKLTEYWDLHQGRNGETWLVVTAIVEDSKYLQTRFMTSSNFRREPDGSKWDPTPCNARK